ncbi:hypothetical protein ACIRBX_18840 [Kitasatospora sp. NPDC096147]|uniref:DUF7507 domain-containing protein n=1 Tax=Kitasatospora sp. NPDC096147 TaxID=3364093 RepID=UPI00382489BA
MTPPVRPATRPRVVRRLLATTVVLLATGLAAPGVGRADQIPDRSGARAGGGSVLLNETFTGSSIADPGFVPLDSVCLTGAAGAPPAGESTTGPCTDASQTTPSVPTPGVTPGWLQLTDGGNYRVGGLLYNRPLPGNGGLMVSFDQYQYGGNGADGIGFFLVDGGVDLKTAGADGGSLGYAQRNLVPGVEGGYLGIGLDAYGNFANDAEQRGLNCPAGQKSPVNGGNQVTDSVTLRGPGEGLDGYCFLVSTMKPDASRPAGQVTTLPGNLRADTTDPEQAVRSVRLTVSPDARPLVVVTIDFHDGKGFQEVLRYQMDTPAPKTYKFGFSGSTGGLTDTHLIRNLEESSVVPLTQLNLVKSVAGERTGRLARTYAVGDTVRYEFLVTNTGTAVLDPVTVTDPQVTDISCPRTALGPMGTPTASMVCTGSHVITVNDSFTGEFSNTATAHGTAPDGEDVPSNPSTATVPVRKLTPGMELSKTASAAEAAPGDTVAYTVTATNTGKVPIDPASFADDLTGVLDDARYNGDATATSGTVTRDGSVLRWTGPLPVGATVTVRYTVTVDSPDEGDLLLRNTVDTTVPGATCADPARTVRAGALPCAVQLPVAQPTPSPTPTPSPSPTPTPTPTPEPSPSPSVGPTPSPVPTPSPDLPPPGELPETGAPVTALVGAAAGLTAAGALLLLRRGGRLRRR